MSAARTINTSAWRPLSQVDYNSALVKSYQFYGSQMIGKLDQADRSVVPPWRGNTFLYEAGSPKLGFGELTGGFMAGSTAAAQAGPVKLTIPIAYSTAMMAWGFLQFPKACPPPQLLGSCFVLLFVACLHVLPGRCPRSSWACCPHRHIP